MENLILPDRLKIDLSNLTEEGISKEFEAIAKELISNYCIVKKSENPSENVTYHFMELEFYYYSPKHPDIITYPRTAKAGDWFFHASGVDICFESNKEMKCFGGILIRALSKHEEGKKTTYITGPLNCCYELFDKFSAFSAPDNFPRIQRKDAVEIVPAVPTESVESVKSEEKGCAACGRYFHFSTSLEKKLEAILRDNWGITKEEMQEETFNAYLDDFKVYLEKYYCFFDQAAFKKCSEWKGKKSYYKIPTKKESRLVSKE